MKTGSILLILFFLGLAQLSAMDKYSAYIMLYSQETTIELKDKHLISKTNYKINFKFKDEKSLKLYRSYPISYSHFDKLENLEVYTKNPTSNGKFKKIEIKDFKKSNASSGSIFYSDQVEIDIDFLGLVVGSEAYISYTMTTEELHFTDPMIFRYYLPIEALQYKLTVPNNVHVSFIEKNMPPNFATYAKQEKKNETIYSWSANNVEPEKFSDHAPSLFYFTPHILYKINDYTLDGVRKNISNSSDDLFQWYANNTKEVNKNASRKIQILADSITKGCVSEIEKVEKIYDWVKSNIRYVAFEAGMEGLVPREAEAIYLKRYGDCKDMSSIQFALLRAAHIPACLTWIGTRSIPYTYSEVPLKNTDNHMIAAYKNGEEWIFLDATDPNGIFGLPTDEIQGKQAMIGLTDSTYELAMVPVVSAGSNKTTKECQIKLMNNDVSIRMTSKFEGLFAGNFANQIHYLTEKEKEENAKGTIKSISNNAILNKYSFSTKEEKKMPKTTFDFTIKEYVKEVGNEKYINLLLDKSLANNQITEESRTTPYSFNLNMSLYNKYVLAIPENYKVTFKPENASFKNENFGFDIKYQIVEEQLICNQMLYVDFPTLLMSAKQFNEWNEFIKLLNKAYKESAILEKKMK
jgi:transglutaminase-like putative cysteine protease